MLDFLLSRWLICLRHSKSLMWFGCDHKPWFVPHPVDCTGDLPVPSHRVQGPVIHPTARFPRGCLCHPLSWITPMWLAALSIAAAMSAGCSKPRSAGPAMQILDESWRWKQGSALPDQSSIFDGSTVNISVAKGETFGLQVLANTALQTKISLPASIAITAMEQQFVQVVAGSTAMYGTGHRGAGWYADKLVAIESGLVLSQAALFDISIPPETPAGTMTGSLQIGQRTIPLFVNVRNITLNISESPRAWGYYDEREIRWQIESQQSPSTGQDTDAAAQSLQIKCDEMFRQHGVLATTTLEASDWPRYRERLRGARYIPVQMSPTESPQGVTKIVTDWISLTKGSNQTPFAIPIDEPKRSMADNVQNASVNIRNSGGGKNTFMFAVTADPFAGFGDVDLYFSLHTKRGQAAQLGTKMFTYNGRPPLAGSMVVDAAPLSTRTWGVIGYRWDIDLWYLWDVLYWHDRHNRDRSKDVKGQPLGRALDASKDARSFQDREDDGNLDGVMAYPEKVGGCLPSMRLKQLRRGLFDRALLESSNCNDVAGRIAEKLMPVALGDAKEGAAPAWSSDDAVWAKARMDLLDEAERCASIGRRQEQGGSR
jgi:hypothetical protein